ncbi:MAG TPA: hypothetical protein PKG54_17755 [Phycisphaerae bacterium]|nr:hypothetical protein [Phycisphaerae bacterium]HQA44562.1 hypothetical protein [Phycisphaerae bacterium]
MHRTVLALVVAAGLGVTGYLWAGDGGKKECPLKAAAAGKEGGCSQACADKKKGACKELAAYASYQRANEVLKGWQEGSAKLAALSEAEKGELQVTFARFEEAHPAGSIVKPTMAFLHKGLGTVVRMDAAAGKMCAQGCQAATPAAGEVAAAAEPQGCAKKAAMASAHKKLQQSVALTAKAHELMLVAYQAAGKEGCSGKGKSGGCSEKAAVSAEGQKGGCGAKTEATLTAATGEKEEARQCAKTAKAAEAAGCGAKTEAALTAAAGEKQCSKASGASGCGAKAEAALTAATGEKQCDKACADKAECAKKLTAQGQAVIAESGELLARWQGAGIRLASMENADREAAEKAASAAASGCPLGSRMPETLETIAALLNDAATLNAQALAAAAKHAEKGKTIPAEVQQLAQTRGEVIAALINVLEKSNRTMQPARQVVSAQ